MFLHSVWTWDIRVQHKHTTITAWAMVLFSHTVANASVSWMHTMGLPPRGIGNHIHRGGALWSSLVLAGRVNTDNCYIAARADDAWYCEITSMAEINICFKKGAYRDKRWLVGCGSSHPMRHRFVAISAVESETRKFKPATTPASILEIPLEKIKTRTYYDRIYKIL